MSGRSDRPKRPYATVATRAERVQEVLALFTMGAPPHRIEHEMASKWATTPRNVRRYVRAARRLIASEAQRLETDEGRRRLRDEMRAQLRALFFDARTAGEYQAALTAAEKLIRLDALNRPEKQEINVKHDIGNTTPTDVLYDTLERELERIKKAQPPS